MGFGGARGAGRGAGFGRGAGGGRGWRRLFHATGLTGWQRATAGWFGAVPPGGGEAEPGIDALERETIPVHLGPGWFLENQDSLVAAGDALEVKGSRITYEGRPAIVAAAVTRGDDVLTLRDARGIPVWSGWRRR